MSIFRTVCKLRDISPVSKFIGLDFSNFIGFYSDFSALFHILLCSSVPFSLTRQGVGVCSILKL
jgi:hypothetical protein